MAASRKLVLGVATLALWCLALGAQHGRLPAPLRASALQLLREGRETFR